MARDEQMIAALKRERATYVAQGNDDRVRQVDEQLRHYGYEGEQDPATGPDGGPKGRTGPGASQQTADGDSSSGEDKTGDGGTQTTRQTRRK